MQGPRVRRRSKIINGHSKVKIKMVNHVELLNQDSNHLWSWSLSIFLLASPSLILAMESLSTPEWST